jgi:hypothetical protein
VIKNLLRPTYYRWLARRERYRPQLGLNDIVSHCNNNLACPTLKSAYDTEAASTGLAKAFRNRHDGKNLFMPLHQFGLLARSMADVHPEWVARTLGWVAKITEEEMTAYSRRLPPLNGSFPWDRIEPGLNRDRTYSFRVQRFAFAPQFSLALHYDSSITDRLANVLDSWVAFAKRDKAGIAYATKLVVTQRFLSLSWSWACLAARPENELSTSDWELEACVLRILFSDARYLLDSVGREFPNNHLLADWFIAWYVEFLFPEFLTPGERERAHEQNWLSELQRQTYRDGTSFEHSVHYHEFVTELAVAYLLLLRSNGMVVPDWVEQRTHRMLRFQADIHGNQIDALALGNTMEDPMFPLDPGAGWSIGGNRELLRSLFEPELSPTKMDDTSVERAFWLLAGNLAPKPELANKPQALRQYPEGGYYMFHDQGEELLFRTGPAPDVPVCGGHMHADLLSIHLRVDDTPLLVDSGTYTYLIDTAETTPPWRRYFMGPSAHNGLTIKDEDSLEPIENSYRSLELQARVSLTRNHVNAGLCWVEARIDSDNRYNGHRRGVIRVVGNYWLVYDFYPDDIQNHSAWAGFQFVTDSDVRLKEQSLVQVKQERFSLWISSPRSDAKLLKGSLEPMAGWVSKSYGVAMPAPQLRYPVNSQSSAWLLAIGSHDHPPFQIDFTESSDQGMLLRIRSEDATDYIFVTVDRGNDALPINAWDIDFQGGLLWLRESRKGAIQLGLLAAQSLKQRRGDIDFEAKGEKADAFISDQASPRPIDGINLAQWSKSVWRGGDLG